MFSNKEKESQLEQKIQSMQIRINQLTSHVSSLEEALKSDRRTLNFILDKKQSAEKEISEILNAFDNEIERKESVSEIKVFAQESVCGFIGYRTEIKLKI